MEVIGDGATGVPYLSLANVTLTYVLTGRVADALSWTYGAPYSRFVDVGFGDGDACDGDGGIAHPPHHRYCSDPQDADDGSGVFVKLLLYPFARVIFHGVVVGLGLTRRCLHAAALSGGGPLVIIYQSHW